MLVAGGGVDLVPVALGPRVVEVSPALVELEAGRGLAYLVVWEGERRAYRMRLSSRNTAAAFEAFTGLSLSPEERARLDALMGAAS